VKIPALTTCWLWLVAAAAGLAGGAPVGAEDPAPEGQPAKPSIVLIVADDCTHRDLEIYGGQAKTPHLKKLAGEGMTFGRCFQASPMCSPTRHSLYTGIYPVKNGAYPNHAQAHPWVKSIAHYLQSAGYRTFLSGKTHVLPKSVFPFEYSALKNNPDPAAIDKGIGECVAANKPFLFIVASNEPHTPWSKGDASAYPPATLKLPPIWVDTPATRDGFSRYLAEITYFDSQVGEVMALIDKHQQRANTLVIVVSEQGNSMPFAKWTCYDAGLQSGCVVRWPGVVTPGSATSAMVEYVDIVPTMLEAASLPQPEILDGKSFLAVLKGQAARHKAFVFGLQTTRGIIQGADFYAIRSARSERYLYLRNLTPGATFQNTEVNGGIFKEWKRKAAGGDKAAQLLVNDFQHRPAEELYDCDADPWNRTNLIKDPKLEATRDELREQLDAWMKQQGDEGQPTELSAREHQAAGRKKGGAGAEEE
jgi:N-sulfoglucosamine sulfohydrolase